MAIPHAHEGNLHPVPSQFILQDTHQNARLFGKKPRIRHVALRMDSTTRALRISPEDGQQSTATILVVPEGVAHFLTDRQTTLASRRSIENFADGFPRRPRPA
jgi:hypothetical protein